MTPSARIIQGEFEDLDLIIADNFSRAAARAGVKHIIYLGGLVPDDYRLSRHLRSRLEVEQSLSAHGVPVTALRAGIVIGRDGSSYNMFKRFIQKSPIIPLSPWTSSLTQPIALPDALALLKYPLQNPPGRTISFDIGSPSVVSYRDLLKKTAEVLGLKRIFFTLPLRSLLIPKYWLAAVSGYPMALVQPLLESMRHSMVAKNTRIQEDLGLKTLDLEQAIRLAESTAAAPPRTNPDWTKYCDDSGRTCFTVRSVQRMPLPAGKNARWVAEEYAAWLPKFFRTLVKAEVDGQRNIRISLVFPKFLLLELTFAHDRSILDNRQLFFVTGGLLCRKDRRISGSGRARLEFREALGSTCVLVAIHDYRPTLPWYVYSFTQALMHVFTMKHFTRHLAGIAKDKGLMSLR